MRLPLSRLTSWPWFALAALLLATLVCYRQGLGGGFLFDDFVNLPALGSTGPVDDWPTFLRYITSGMADPTGRPLALLSFLVDARDWPADPAPFLRTNLLLHLVNGALLFSLLRMLGRYLDGRGDSTDAAALLGAGLWLLHPLFVSTTLYIVQREAMLPATFTLLGLIAYVHGRNLFGATPRAGAAWMTLAIVLGTLLGVLSKANGALLPMLAWMLEMTVLRAGEPAGAPSPRARTQLRWLRLVLLVVPSLLIIAYIATLLPKLGEANDRPWTIGQRLLTEPRVLLDYLQLLVVPRVLSTGLYNDDYVASTGLLNPFATLPALLFLSALVALGILVRRRAPALAAALLFFFVGHLLESTALPLELYFEHRNYLPAMLLFWPLARAICAWRVPLVLRVAASGAVLLICALITYQRVELWSKPEQMALLWAFQNPGSARAQATAAIVETNQGRPDLAMQRLGPLWHQRPHDLQLALNYADAACAVRALTTEEDKNIGTALREASEGGQLVHIWLGKVLAGKASGRGCSRVDFATIDDWLSAARANPHFSTQAGRQQDLHSLAGILALYRKQPANALAEFDRALEAWTTPQAAAKQAALLATHGHYRQALDHLDHYVQLQRPEPGLVWNMQAVHMRVLEAQGYWPRELAILRGKLEAELATPADHVIPAPPGSRP